MGSRGAASVPQGMSSWVRLDLLFRVNADLHALQHLNVFIREVKRPIQRFPEFLTGMGSQPNLQSER